MPPPQTLGEGVPPRAKRAGIDIARERTIALSQVPEHLPRSARGGKVHVASVYRWTQHGLRGVRLEWLQVGRRRCTSVEALQRFFDRLTDSSIPGAPLRRQVEKTPARRGEQERAARVLRELLGSNTARGQGRAS